MYTYILYTYTYTVAPRCRVADGALQELRPGAVLPRPRLGRVNMYTWKHVPLYFENRGILGTL